MKENKNYMEDLKGLQAFMKEKSITLAALSKEMNYSTNHVAKVFSGGSPPGEKFVGCMLKGIQRILQKDLKDFYEFMRGKSWITFRW